MFSKNIKLVLFSICLSLTFPGAKLTDFRLFDIEVIDKEISFSSEDCTKGVHQWGKPICRSKLLVWKWNHRIQTCSTEIYGGCNATPNNFKSFDECISVAESICKAKKPAFSEKDCNKPVEDNHGKKRCARPIFMVYRWSNKRNRCVLTIYSGCNATPNNFETLEECKSVAEPICYSTAFSKRDCNKPVQIEKKRCAVGVKVFTWSNKRNRCVSAIYRGCNATANNFETLKECTSIAEPICDPKEPVFSKSDCNKPVESGYERCAERVNVFTWSNKMNQCVLATYGGCTATTNNFETLTECTRIALPVCYRRKTNPY